MMDHGEILQRVDTALSTACADAKRLRCSVTPFDPVSKVLDDDDLLIEIIVRLGFPTSLVHAALVCRRWFRHASDPVVLDRFRKLHPPRLLGFYAGNVLDKKQEFVPMLPQPSELNIVIRRADFSLNTYKSTGIHIAGCRNGKVLYRLYDNTTLTFAEAVHKPLCPDRETVALPQVPTCQLQHDSFCTFRDLVYKEEDDNFPYLYVWIEQTGGFTKSTVYIYMLQDGAWRKLTSITGTHPHFVPLVQRHVLVHSKIYITSLNNILVLDLSASSLSIIQHPQGTEYRGIVHTKLSRPDDDSGVHLIHANELQLDIWLHKKDKWSLLNSICLKDMLANLRMTDPTFENDHTGVVLINQVGNNVEFVFLQMGRSVLYLDTKCRTLCKVHGAGRGGILLHIHPFFMIWPPTFPALKDCKVCLLPFG